MNEVWIKDSYQSAELFRRGGCSSDDELWVTRILDATGMFETSWLLFDHHSKKTNYGYPK